jgi:hypothetical protein
MLSVIPGNHDRYTAHAMRERRFERHFGDLLATDFPARVGPHGYPFARVVGSDLAVIGLDSTRLAPVPGLSFGQLGADQLRALSRLLEEPELRDRWLAVLVHHAPLHRDARPDRMAHGLWDGAELLRMLAGRACSLHHGHVHHRYWHRAAPGRPDVFNGGSATMEGDEGYWLIERGPHGLCAEMRAPKIVPVEPCPPARAR